MRKRLTFIIMAFLLCQGLEAQNKDGLNFFNLVLPDNAVVSYELADGVDIQFQDSIMVVNDLSFYMEDGVKYFFSEEEIAALGENCDENASYIAADKLYVKCKGEGNVVISDLLGRVVFSQVSRYMQGGAEHARECAKNGNSKRTTHWAVRLLYLCEICERFMSCMMLPIGVLPAGVLPRLPMAYMVTKVASSRHFGRHSGAVWEAGGKIIGSFW